MFERFRSAISRRVAQSSTSTPAPQGLGSMGGLSFFSFGQIELSTTAVACTNVIANSIAILPLNLYFKNPSTGARQKAGWHPLYALLRRRPNPAESPVVFFEKLLRHIVQKGNAYIFKARGADGSVLALSLLSPEYVVEDYTYWPVVHYRYGGRDYTDDDILHIPSLITNDYGHGTAVVDLAKAAVVLGIQLDRASLASFGNGIDSRLTFSISDALKDTPANDTDTAQKVARAYSDYIARNYSGPDNAGKPLIQIPGMSEPKKLDGTSNKEAELLESRKWQELEICKAFGVPPWLINGTYDVKYGGLEQGMTIFLNFCLMPYLRHIEQRFNTLLSPYEQEAYYFEFDFNVLLRPDEKSRAEFYSKLFNLGAMGPGDICARENIDPPAEGADARFVPANMMPLRQDVLDAYMAGAKLKAKQIGGGGAIGQPTDPARAAGDQAQ